MNDIFTSQKIEQLGRQGYVESAAYPDFFNPLFAALKAAHPKARYVEKVGPHANSQIVYLPKARRSILARLKREKAEYEKAMLATGAAIELLNTEESGK